MGAAGCTLRIANTAPSPSLPGTASVQPSTKCAKIESTAPLAASSASKRLVTLKSACCWRANRRSSSSSIASASSAETASTRASGSAPCFRRVPARITPRKRPRDPTGAHTARRSSSKAPSTSLSAGPPNSCSMVLPAVRGSNDGKASGESRSHSNGVPAPPRSETTPRKVEREPAERESISPSLIQTPARSISAVTRRACTALRIRSDLFTPGDCARRAISPEFSPCLIGLPLSLIHHQQRTDLASACPIRETNI